MASEIRNKNDINGPNPSSSLFQINQSPVDISGSKSGDGPTPINPSTDPTLEEVKDRMEGVLERIKSRVGEISSMSVESGGLQFNNYSEVADPEGKPERHESGMAIPPVVSGSHSPTDTLANDELAKRKAQIVAAARAAETKAREAEEKFRQIESRLETELQQRRTAEMRVREIEETYKQQISSLEAEGLRRLEVEETLEAMTARLDEEVNARAEAEKAFEAMRAQLKEPDAPAEAENALEAMRAQLQEAERTLFEVEMKKEEAEARARALEETTREIEARVQDAEETAREAEAKAEAAEQTIREVEAMIYESDALATELQQKYKAVETRLHQETELRLFAEQQLKALTDELNINLEVDWSKLETDIAIVSPVPAGVEQRPAGNEDFHQQLLAQIEAERQARINAERDRAEAEQITSEVQAALVKAEEKYAKSESRYEELLQRQQSELRKLQLQISGGAAPQSTSASSKTKTGITAKEKSSVTNPQPDQMMSAAAKERHQNQISLMWHGAAIFGLFIILVLLSIAAYRQF